MIECVMKLPENVRKFFQQQGRVGAAKRHSNLSPAQRREIARKAAKQRWGKKAAGVGRKPRGSK